MQLGDIGTVLRLTVHDTTGAIVNLAAATTLQVYLKPPTGSTLTKTAVLSTNGTDGKIQYTTALGDINVTGQWNIQGYVVFSSSRKFKTEIRNFEVLSNLV